MGCPYGNANVRGQIYLSLTELNFCKDRFETCPYGGIHRVRTLQNYIFGAHYALLYPCHCEERDPALQRDRLRNLL